MGTRPRASIRWIAAVALTGILAGCSDGDGGATLRAFFGTNGRGECRSVVVDLDLDAADSVLARSGAGVDCTLAAILEKEGCDVAFAEVEGGILRVTITGCPVADSSPLFDCGLASGDLRSLQEQAAARCTCEGDACEEDPAVCVAATEGPGACEDCVNGNDDDGNGDVDCDDRNCASAVECGPAGTTTTSSSTSTTSWFSTMTTMPFPDGFVCTIRFHLDSDVTVGAIQWTTDYSASGLVPEGEGDEVACSSLQESAILSASNQGAGALAIGMVTLAGVDGPADLVRCLFRGPFVPQPGNFTVRVVDAASPESLPIDPSPTVSVGSIECVPLETTTTTLVDRTTTTLPIPEDPYEFLVRFRLDSASAAVGALQWSTDYSSAGGKIRGSGGTPACTANLALGALFAPNDLDGEQRLNLGLVALNPFGAPVELVTCSFAGSPLDPPRPEDFVIDVEDATDGSGSPINAVISVAVAPAL